MLTLETGTLTNPSTSRRLDFEPHTGGFSLIELLVVITIIGIFSGAAILSLDILGNDRDLEREAFRLKSMTKLLTQESVMEGRSYGILFSERGYRFYIYDYRQLLWLDPIGDHFLAEYRLQEPMSIGLFLENQEIVLESEFDQELLADPEPQVIIYASGELTPFKAVFSREENEGSFAITAEINGFLELSEQGYDGP
jgi:general secretion pathway protein H